jgi:hypothetical protein
MLAPPTIEWAVSERIVGHPEVDPNDVVGSVAASVRCRCHDGAWEVGFASSGPAAIAQLDRGAEARLPEVRIEVIERESLGQERRPLAAYPHGLQSYLRP